MTCVFQVTWCHGIHCRIEYWQVYHKLEVKALPEIFDLLRNDIIPTSGPNNLRAKRCSAGARDLESRKTTGSIILQPWSRQVIRFANVNEEAWPQVIHCRQPDVISKFPAHRHAFDDRLLRMCLRRIEFNIQPFFHGPDNEKAYPPGEDDAVRRHAGEHFRPVGYFRQYLIEYQHQFRWSAFK